jgi:isocitrate/isopropylmalate dehydrogenase
MPTCLFLLFCYYGELTEDTQKNAEQFICKLYDQTVDTVDKARTVLFGKLKGPEHMPPTSDALVFHIRRAHYQAMVWMQAHKPIPDFPTPLSMGWTLVDDQLK